MNILLLQILLGIILIALYILHVFKGEQYNYRWVVPVLVLIAILFGGVTVLRIPKELNYKDVKILIPYKNVLSINFK